MEAEVSSDPRAVLRCPKCGSAEVVPPEQVFQVWRGKRGPNVPELDGPVALACKRAAPRTGTITRVVAVAILCFGMALGAGESIWLAMLFGLPSGLEFVAFVGGGILAALVVNPLVAVFQRCVAESDASLKRTCVCQRCVHRWLLDGLPTKPA